jgi:hypothetical protein
MVWVMGRGWFRGAKLASDRHEQASPDRGARRGMHPGCERNAQTPPCLTCHRARNGASSRARRRRTPGAPSAWSEVFCTDFGLCERARGVSGRFLASSAARLSAATSQTARGAGTKLSKAVPSWCAVISVSRRNPIAASATAPAKIGVLLRHCDRPLVVKHVPAHRAGCSATEDQSLDGPRLTAGGGMLEIGHHWASSLRWRAGDGMGGLPFDPHDTAPRARLGAGFP